MDLICILGPVIWLTARQCSTSNPTFPRTMLFPKKVPDGWPKPMLGSSVSRSIGSNTNRLRKCKQLGCATSGGLISSRLPRAFFRATRARIGRVGFGARGKASMKWAVVRGAYDFVLRKNALASCDCGPVFRSIRSSSIKQAKCPIARRKWLSCRCGRKVKSARLQKFFDAPAANA